MGTARGRGVGYHGGIGSRVAFTFCNGTGASRYAFGAFSLLFRAPWWAALSDRVIVGCVT